jgi:O-antigen ligase
MKGNVERLAFTLAGPLVLLLVLVARVDARSTTSPHAHVFLAQELVIVVGALALLGATLWARIRARWDRITLVVCALVAFEVASSFHAADRWVALRSATLWISGLLVYGCARFRATDGWSRGLDVLVVPVGIAAASVILEALGIVHLSAAHHAPGGLLGERNVAAQLLVCAAPAVAYVAMTEGGPWRRRGALLVLGLSAGAVVLGRTRSAWIAGLVLFVVLARVAIGRTEAGRRARGTFGVVVLGATLAVALPTGLRWRSPHPYRDTFVHLVDPSSTSGAGRLVQYATTLRMAAAHPTLGVGPGNWAARYVSFAEKGDPTVHEALTPVNRLPNSDLLGFVAERGIFASCCLVALVVSLFRRGGPSREGRGLRRATLLVVAIVGALDAVLQTPAALLLVAWVLGLTSPVTRPSRSGAWTMPARAFQIVAVAVMSVMAVFAGRRLGALDVAAHARGSDDLDRALRLDPGDLGLRLSTAESWIADGRCDRAREHLDAVRRSSPASPALGELERRCALADRSGPEPH